MSRNTFHSKSKLLVGMTEVLPRVQLHCLNTDKDGAEALQRTRSHSSQWPTVKGEGAVMTMHQRKFNVDVNVYSMRVGKH